MRAVIQRVMKAAVSIDGQLVSTVEFFKNSFKYVGLKFFAMKIFVVIMVLGVSN